MARREHWSRVFAAVIATREYNFRMGDGEFLWQVPTAVADAALEIYDKKF